MLKLIWMPIVLNHHRNRLCNQSLKKNNGQVYETESEYNYIQVQEVNGYTLCVSTMGRAFIPFIIPSTLFYNGPWELFMVGPYFYADRSPDDVKQHGDHRSCGRDGGTSGNRSFTAKTF
jgi:hypothetical protein